MLFVDVGRPILRSLSLHIIHAPAPIRSIYEKKAVCVNGEFPGIPDNGGFLASTVYTIRYIESSSIEKLYTFTVSEEVLSELSQIAEKMRLRYIDGNFKSLSILEEMEL